MADRVPGGEDVAEAQEAFEYDVFLSFASANHEAADAICQTLREGGLRVFWAPDTLDDAMGRSFVNAIGARLLGSRHFVLFWTAEAKESQWVQEEHETFYSQCYIRARGARRLVILPDGREPLSTLPGLLRNLQVARSAQEVLARLGGSGPAPTPKTSVPSRTESPRSVHPASEPAVAASIDPPAGTATAGPLGLRMRFVPSGAYTIGSPEVEPGRSDDETLHEVTLTRGVWLGETPVTQAQWRQLVPGPKQPSYFKSGGDDLPVESINWFEAVEFANRLSDLEGLARCYKLIKPKGTLGGGDFTCDDVIFAGLDCPGYRLPTESEWEFSARAGTSTAIYTGALTLVGERNGPELDPIAWYGGNSGATYEGAIDGSKWTEMQFAAPRSGPHPVGKKAANKWGFHDLLGNVSEWTGDWYGDYPKGRVVDPLGPPKGPFRVIRGGSWFSDARDVRAAYRYHVDPSNRWDNLGFRFARGQSALQPRGAEPQVLRPRRRGEPD